MEDRNILWGELVGGLLIVGCSIALVISLWHSLEEVPYFQFLLFTAITTALFGAGKYTVQEEVPAGYALTAQTGKSTTSSSGFVSTGNNFADFQNGQISGTVFQDNDGNGFKNDSAYTGPAVTVDLYLNNNKVGSTTTDGSGKYAFNGLHGVGTYTVQEEVPGGYTLTAQTAASIVSWSRWRALPNNKPSAVCSARPCPRTAECCSTAARRSRRKCGCGIR